MSASSPSIEARHSGTEAFASSAIEGLCKFAVWPLRHALPLATRKAVVTWIGRGRVPGGLFFAVQLLDDMARDHRESFHRFLWLNHLGYAKTFNASRFGPGRLEPSRQMLFADIRNYFQERGVAPETHVKSVFDAGCSLGYVLRFAETEVFPSATVLHGLDVDKYAVESGMEYLRGVGSKVEIVARDILDLDRLMGDRKYDVVMCCGVLLYFEEATAEGILRTLLQHTRQLLGLICLAHPTVVNNQLAQSGIRARDGARIHNLEALVQRAGGRVVFRRWKRPEAPDEYSAPFFLLVEPADAPIVK